MIRKKVNRHPKLRKLWFVLIVSEWGMLKRNAGIRHIVKHAEMSTYQGQRYVGMHGDMGKWEKTIRSIVMETIIMEILIIIRHRLIRVMHIEITTRIRIMLDIKISMVITEEISEEISEVIIGVEEVHIINTAIMIIDKTTEIIEMKIMFIRNHMVIRTI